MNTRIFRKVALARLSSPEQLDQVLRVTSRKSWLVLTALSLAASGAMVWGYQGRVATTAAGDGIFVRSGGVLNVVARGSGPITVLYVKAGDKVKANQVVARIAQPALEERILLTRRMMEQVSLDGQRSQKLRSDSAVLRVEAIERQKQNLEREIVELGEQADIAAEQVPLQEQLFQKGLVTKQQVLQAQERVTRIRADIASHRAQIKSLEAQRFGEESSPLMFDADVQAKRADYERTLAGLQKEMQLSSEVVSPYAGEVLELKALAGGTVGAGYPILSIQPDSTQLEALVYIPSTQAKEITPGMQVQLSPSTVRREEFGYLRGTVLYVSGYPATSAALMRNFQNETLVTALNAKGPVNEVRVQLEIDSASFSGFKWSSGGGPQLAISSGTICTAQVVTREQPPITLVFPAVKQALGVS